MEPEFATPCFLLLFFALTIGFSTLSQLANTRIIGEAAIGISLPYIKEGVLLATGYGGVAGWLAPIYVYGSASRRTAVYFACD